MRNKQLFKIMSKEKEFHKMLLFSNLKKLWIVNYQDQKNKRKLKMMAEIVIDS